MACFELMPEAKSISRGMLMARAEKVVVRLRGEPYEQIPFDVGLRSDNGSVSITGPIYPFPLNANVSHWIISGKNGTLTRLEAFSSNAVWGYFYLNIRKRNAPDVTVRPYTIDVFNKRTAGIRPNTKDIIADAANDLERVPVYGYQKIDPAHYTSTYWDSSKWKLRFLLQKPTHARLGVFVVTRGNFQRAVIVLLKEEGTPNRALCFLTNVFTRFEKYNALGWQDPLSVRLIEYVAKDFVLFEYGRALANSTTASTVLLLPVRAKTHDASQLEYFLKDTPFVQEIIDGIMVLIAGRSTALYEFGAFSNAISQLNTVLAGFSQHASVASVYNIDPAGAVSAKKVPGAILKQYSRGRRDGGFECLPGSVWENEKQANPERKNIEEEMDRARRAGKPLDYVHDYCMPRYALTLGLDTREYECRYGAHRCTLRG